MYFLLPNESVLNKVLSKCHSDSFLIEWMQFWVNTALLLLSIGIVCVKPYAYLQICGGCGGQQFTLPRTWGFRRPRFKCECRTRLQANLRLEPSLTRHSTCYIATLILFNVIYIIIQDNIVIREGYLGGEKAK